MRLLVDTGAGTLVTPDRRIACRIGVNGACDADAKREGDGMTPRGTWPIRGVLLRGDRVPVPIGLRLPWRFIRSDNGWSDDLADPAYNRPVRHPYRFSAERLWREDGLYDVVVVLGHNDAPPVPGHGSAIFFHLTADHPTEGCVAIAREEMLALLPAVDPESVIEIR